MYAVVATGGKQYRVEKDQVLRIEKIPGEVGDTVSFDRILLFSDGENLEIGRPVLDKASVSGRIVEQRRDKKVIIFKFKRRKRYRRKNGHRQSYTAVKIETLNMADGGTA